MRNSILALLLCTLLATCAAAQPSRHDLQRNPLLCAANHVAYPWNDANLPRLTPPPAGYEPFYIDHYGRHGSRWLSTASTPSASCATSSTWQAACKTTTPSTP